MPRTQLVDTRDALRAAVADARAVGRTIGLVPTMGALHEGHLSLVDACQRECDATVVSVFVNPTQFGPGEDFHRYPRPRDRDVALLGQRGVDVIFAPSVDEMYPPDGDFAAVDPGAVAQPLEGRFRPGHFRGVATVVLKLLNLVAPDAAYFGHKDYQQTLVVRRMVADLFLPVRIVVCPTVREPDGLALSSRNAYLTADQRRSALSLSQALRTAAELAAAGERSAAVILDRMRRHIEAHGAAIDYVALVDPETLRDVARIDGPTVAAVAARVGTTRLIDNVRLQAPGSRR